MFHGITHGFMGFESIILLLIIIFLVLWISKYFNSSKKNSPIEELKMRLAKGEITMEEFIKIKKTLKY